VAVDRDAGRPLCIGVSPGAAPSEPPHVRFDEAIAAILSAIRELMHPPAPKRRGIAFTADIDERP
jgi:hypothetical protein